MTTQTAAPPTGTSASTRIAAALRQRLGAAAEVLLGAGAAEQGLGRPDSERAGMLLVALVDRVRGSDRLDEVWLLRTALAAAFPDEAQVLHTRRLLRRTSALDAQLHLLEAAHAAVLEGGSPAHEMRVVQGEVLVDVDFCATSEHHTGIQRVVREVIPRWVDRPGLTLVAWTPAQGGYRPLESAEAARVLHWYARQHADRPDLPAPPTGPPTIPTPVILVPWRSRVLLPENVQPARCAALAALAQHSGNAVAAVGYDCIPAVSPELVHPNLPEEFMQYLSVIKHVDLVAGISASATREFQGFARMLPTQGLPAPRVVEVPLPVEVPSSAAVDATSGAREPMVLTVGSFEPRKNQLAVLLAAERLWRAGHAFRMHFVGGGGWRTEFEAVVARLQKAGRPVSVSVGVSDQELWQLYRSARFTVFASLHEGFGLPVAESLACGVPALTTDYGSTAELAAEGGALLVDPRDDDALVEGMRQLLTDDELLLELRQQALARPSRTWDDYAGELWAALTSGSVPA